MGTSSADPDRLQSHVRSSQALNDELKRRLGAVADRYDFVKPRLRWGVFDAKALLDDLATFVRLNDEDDRWVAGIAQAFAAAGSGGGLVRLPDARIARSLAAAGIASGERARITVDDAIVAGAPPTSGFAADPVCTASGTSWSPRLTCPCPGGPPLWPGVAPTTRAGARPAPWVEGGGRGLRCGPRPAPTASP